MKKISSIQWCIFSILGALWLFSSCTHNAYYAAMPVHFTKVDSAETVSFAARPMSTFQIRVVPQKHMYIVGNAWVKYFGASPYSLPTPRQIGISYAYGLGFHTARYFHTAQFAVEGGLTSGKYKSLVLTSAYVSDARYIKSSYVNGPYIKGAAYFNVGKKLTLGVGLLYQQMHLDYATPKWVTKYDPTLGVEYSTQIIDEYPLFMRRLLASLNAAYEKHSGMIFEASVAFNPILNEELERGATNGYFAIQLGWVLNLNRGAIFQKKSNNVSYTLH
jgi:hypothetical protein